MNTGIGLAKQKCEGRAYLHDTGEDITDLIAKAEKLLTMLPKSTRISKDKFIYGFVMVSLDRV